MDWLSSSDAAAELGLSNQRVRQLISDGRLQAHRLGGRWLIEVSSVERLAASHRRGGRPWAPPRAWALLSLAGARQPDWLPARENARLRHVLARQPLSSLAAQLDQRGDTEHWYLHPGLLGDFLAEDGVVISGARASGRLRDSGPDDVYVHPGIVDSVVDRFAPDRDADDPNLIVRVVRGPWPFRPGERNAWPVLAAIDLLEHGDSRSRRVAKEMLANA